MKVLTAQQARQVDERTCTETGIPNLLLMENASIRLVDYLEQHVGDLRARRILILAGKGNNGGDGLAAARQLMMRGACPQVCLLAAPDQLRGDALQNYQMALASGVPIYEALQKAGPGAWPPEWKHFELLLDGILGTGSRGPADGFLAEAIQWINEQYDGYVVSIDLPSGLEADHGLVPGPAVCANATVTFTAPKLCHLLQPASELVGRLIVAPIGTPQKFLDSGEFRCELFERSQLSPVLGARPEAAHKGQFGRILVVAGGRGKAGAAAMAGLGALRSGAGLVTIAVPASCQELVAAFAPELMTEGLPETAMGMLSSSAVDRALSLASNADLLALGPGIGQDPETLEFLRRVFLGTRLPLVMDADALNLLAASRELLAPETDRIVVLTPHPGEMARLTEKSIAEIQNQRLAVAGEYAKRWRVFLVLKGSRTITATPQGLLAINVTGNPGMATGGSGDVLTGMVASLLAQQLLRAGRDSVKGQEHEILQAIATAVCWHGLAGDCAEAKTGQLSLVATDILRHLPEALKQLLEPTPYWLGGNQLPFFKLQSPRKEKHT